MLGAHRAFYFYESGDAMKGRGRCGLFPIHHNGGWPVLTIIPFGIVANARKGYAKSKSAVVDAFKHFAEITDADIDFDDLVVDAAIRAATQDEIKINEILDYPVSHKR